MASWQAHLLNTLTRNLMKPLVRLGSISMMRASTERFDRQLSRSIPDDISSRWIRGKEYEAEWVRIKGKRAKKTILYFPGGGFVVRLPVQQKVFIAQLCRAANARAVMVHYRLAPEYPFPSGLEDCVAAYHDLLDQGVKPEDISLYGESAGGGLVLSTLIALRDEGTPMPGNAIIVSPLADLTFSGESRKYNDRKDPMLPNPNDRASRMHYIYLADAVPEGRYTSPVFADFDGLPPILGQVGSTETLLSDTLRAAEQANKSGVPFYLEVWEDMPHVWHMFGFLPEAAIAMARIADFINNGHLDPLPAKYGTDKPRPPERGCIFQAGRSKQLRAHL